MYFFSIGRFLWVKIRYRLRAGAKRCNESFINYVWKRLVIGVLGVKSEDEDEEIKKTPSLKEFIYNKRIWELETSGVCEEDDKNITGNL